MSLTTHDLNAFAAGQGRRLMRMVGACKEGTEDYFKPPELVLLYVLQVRRFGVSAVT